MSKKPAKAKKPSRKPKSNKIKYILAAVLVCLLGAGGYMFFSKEGAHPEGQAEISDEDRLLAEVNQLFKEGRTGQARTSLKILVRTYPEHEKILAAAALASFDSGKYYDTIELAERALAINPKLPDILAILGKSYLEFSQLDRALDASRKALKINPELFLPYFTVGKIYLHEGNYKQALAVLEKSVTLDKNHPEAWSKLSSAYLKLNYHKKALAASQKALKINPDLPGTHFNLAMVYFNLENGSKALYHIQKSEALFKQEGNKTWSVKTRHNKSLIIEHFKLRPEDLAD